MNIRLGVTDKLHRFF